MGVRMCAACVIEARVAALAAAGEIPVTIGAIEPGRGVKSNAKGKGEAEAVRYSASLRYKG